MSSLCEQACDDEHHFRSRRKGRTIHGQVFVLRGGTTTKAQECGAKKNRIEKLLKLGKSGDVGQAM